MRDSNHDLDYGSEVQALELSVTVPINPCLLDHVLLLDKKGLLVLAGLLLLGLLAAQGRLLVRRPGPQAEQQRDRPERICKHERYRVRPCTSNQSL
jgi:hypothetical protein